MMEDQRLVTPTDMGRKIIHNRTNRRNALSRLLRNIVIGVGIAILLACIECALWIFNPFHLFGSGTSHNLTTLLSILANTPLLWLMLLLQVIAVCALMYFIDKPLAFRRYIRDVQKAQERYRALYTPLTSLSAIYETSLTCYQDMPDLSTPGKVQHVSMLELAQDLGHSFMAAKSHQLILGAPGAGKSVMLYFYQFTVLQRFRSVIFGSDKIPIYIPLRNYNLYLDTHSFGTSGEKLVEGTQFLLDFLYSSDLIGLNHLRPFLHTLVAQGRILFLCDSLNEIDEKYRAAVSVELAEMLRQNQNQLVLTCREVDFQQQQQLAQAVVENLVVRVYINPLDEKHERSFVERYIGEQDAGTKWRHTAGQVMEVINRSRLRDHCTNPLMFFALMEVIDDIGVNRGKKLATRGQLLRAFVEHLIQHEISQPQWSNANLTEHDVLIFLCELACAARWTNSSNAIQIPTEGLRLEELAAGLQIWLSEHPAQSLVAIESVVKYSKTLSDSQDDINQPYRSTLHEPYSQEELIKLLQFTQSSYLIEINPGGIMSFRHELISAYFVAEYFVTLGEFDLIPVTSGALYHNHAGQWEVGAQFITPIALWAGLLDDPEEYALRFAKLGKQNPDFNLEALTLSLVCLGVAYSLPQADDAHQLDLPSHLAEAVGVVVRDKQTCDLLARLFTRFALEGAQEIYQSLFPLLVVDAIDEMVTRLNIDVILELLFNQLCVVIDTAEYEAMVKRLVRLLGHLGAAAIPRATELSQPLPDRSDRLRSAAINILGGTKDEDAVEPLIVCLRDSNQSIVGRAANALIRLGSELSFTRLVHELEDRTPTSAREQVHWTVLHILERFQNEPDVARQLTPSQHLRLVSVFLHVLTSNYAPEDQQKARDMLVKQARNAGVSPAGERALEFLVQNLSSDKDPMARATLRTLKEVGPASTPYLLEQLKPQTPEMMRMRIVEVLADVRDPRAMPYLLRSLGDPALMVQQQVALALHAFAPESIAGLIDCVLHSDSDLIATRAEQILGDIGDEATTPLIQSLTPVAPGRTHLLVQVLERIRNPLAIPALIALLENPQQSSQIDQTIQVAVVHALGQFPDDRVVAPLLEMLASPNPLIYEGAINALSCLEDVALYGLIAALDGDVAVKGQEEHLEDRSREEGRSEDDQHIVLTSRIERAILGMEYFPGEQLLGVLGRGSDAQAQHIINIFLAKGIEAAQVLVRNLFHPNSRLQNYVRYILGEMNGQEIVPALLEVLDHPEPAWRAVITALLLNHPREAIPPLVGLLDEDARGDAAEVILLEFGPLVLPNLVPGLDALSGRAQERSRRIVVTLVLQAPELVHEVVQLFNLVPPQRAHEVLLDLLTGQLVDVSVPALLEGLEDAHLIGATSEALVRLVNKDNVRSDIVMKELLAALRMEQRQHGAEITLVEIGEKAVPGVGNLITDSDPLVAQAAQNILCEMGVPAFSFIWAAHSDTTNRARRTSARGIFRRMRTVVIKDELVHLLKSSDSDDISMALALLIERINDETVQADREHEMVPALLEYVQTHSDERASLRIVALLLLLGGNVVIDHMADILYNYPNHQQVLVHAFLLLGEDGIEALLEILYDPGTPTLLRAETASLLGILAPNMDIREYASMLGEYGLWAGRLAGMTDVLHPDRLAISLHALGGLLTGGYWDANELQNLRNRSQEHSAEHELYDILLGWRYSPQITILESDLQHEREEHKQNTVKFSHEILGLRVLMSELEEQLEQVRKEHGFQGEELDQANKKIEELQHSLNRVMQEKQSIQDNVQRTTQERQTLRNSLQEITREKDVLELQVAQWRHYADQLEQGLKLNRPQSPKKR